MSERLQLDDVEALARRALAAAGASALQAGPVARSIRDAEADGLPNIGLVYLPFYLRHLRSGRVRGDAVPRVERLAAGAVRVDADDGFAHPAIVAGEPALIEAARACGTAGLAVANSYASGVVGWFVERIALQGLIGFCFTNASASIAPWGGTIPLFGTNPIGFAVPRADGRAPLVIDQSSSTTARINVTQAAVRGERVPDSWVLDHAGRPTTDPSALDTGSMAPAGGYKGAALALLVEILAGGLSGGRWSFEVDPLALDSAGPTGIGQFLLAIDPARFAVPGFADRIEVLLTAMLAQDGVRLPGDRRLAHRAAAERDGVLVEDAVLAAIADASR